MITDKFLKINLMEDQHSKRIVYKFVINLLIHRNSSVWEAASTLKDQKRMLVKIWGSKLQRNTIRWRTCIRYLKRTRVNNQNSKDHLLITIQIVQLSGVTLMLDYNLIVLELIRVKIIGKNLCLAQIQPLYTKGTHK